MNLYTLTFKQAQLRDKLETAGYDEQTIADTLEGERGDIEAALEDLATIRGEKIARKTVIMVEVERLLKLAEAEAGAVETIDRQIMFTLNRIGEKKISTTFHSFSVKTNPPSIDVFGEVPQKYYVQKPAPAPAVSKALIKDAIKAGEDVSAFAKQVQDTRLVIE